MDVAEKRVHDEAAPTVRAFVASGVGVVAVSVAGDRVGRFGVEHRCVARDVAADGVLAVATDEDVFLRTVDGDDTDYRATGFGPATAVGVDSTGDPKDPAGHALVAADVEGRIARRVDDDWFDLAEVDHPVRAVDGDLVAAGDGVYTSVSMTLATLPPPARTPPPARACTNSETDGFGPSTDPSRSSPPGATVLTPPATVCTPGDRPNGRPSADPPVGSPGLHTGRPENSSL
jgi:hypothetical protein